MFALLALALAPVELPEAGWVVFDQPAVAETSRMGCGENGRTTLADDAHDWHMNDDEAATRHDRFTVFLHLKDGVVREMRIYTPDCAVIDAADAASMQVSPENAVTLFTTLLEAPQDRLLESRLVAALAHVDHVSAAEQLERFAAMTTNRDLSQDALLWLALRRGAHGRDVVIHHTAAGWPLEHRQQAVMALAFSEDAVALDTVRQVAREASAEELRAHAVTALGITSAPGALAELHSIFLVDESPQVREQAIFGLAQLDNGEAARILAGIIRSPRYGEHRRTALFWLAQMQGAGSEAVMEELLAEVL